MFCIKCGKMIDEDARFCPYCGEKVENLPPELPAEPTFTPELPAEPAPAPEPPAEPEAGDVAGQAYEPIVEPMPEPAPEAIQPPPLEHGENPLPDSLATVTKSWALRKKGYIIAAISIAVAGIALAVILNWYNSPYQRFSRELKSGDYSGASALYYGALTSADINKADETIEKVANEALEKYNSGSAEYEDVENWLNQLYSGFGLPEIPQITQELKQLKESKLKFQQAADAESDGDTYAALKYYGTVAEEDEQYNEAQTKIQELQETYKPAVIAQAKEMAEKKNYEGAQNLLLESQEVLPDDKDISSLLEEYGNVIQENNIVATLAEAEEKGKAGNYAAAVRSLGKVTGGTGADSRVTTKLAEYKQKYLEQTKADVNALAEEKKYEQGMSVLQNAALLLGDGALETQIEDYRKLWEERILQDAAELATEGKYEEAVAKLNQATNSLGELDVFMTKIEEYRDRYPVCLVDLNPSAGEDYSDSSFYTDIYDNATDCSLSFRMYIDFGNRPRTFSSEYVANGKYKFFSGTVMMSEGVSDEAQGKVEVYVDDVLKYGPATFVKKSEPTPFTVDITNAKFVKIVVTSVKGRGNLLISEPTFHS